MSPVRPARRIDPANVDKLVADERLEEQKGEFKFSVDRLRSAYFWFYNYYNNRSDHEYGEQEIAKWDGGESKGKHYKPLWNKIVHKLQQLNITNIERFVAAQFVFRTDKRIYPTYLLSTQALDNYERHCQVADRQILETLRSDVSNFKSLFNECSRDPNPTASVLSNLSNDLSPLFRYIVACQEKLDSIANKIIDSAYAQFKRDPEGYLKTWGASVPKSLLLSVLPDEERSWYG